MGSDGQSEANNRDPSASRYGLGDAGSPKGHGIPAIGVTHLLGIHFAPRIGEHHKSLAVTPSARHEAANEEGQAQLI